MAVLRSPTRPLEYPLYCAERIKEQLKIYTFFLIRGNRLVGTYPFNSYGPPFSKISSSARFRGSGLKFAL